MSATRPQPRVLVIVTAVLLAAVFAANLSAQVPMHVFQGGDTPKQYGDAICAAGDVNGDGFADLAISESDDAGPGTGRVEIRSGRDGSLLQEVFGTSPGEEFGRYMAPLGDLDGDGHPELMVGSGDGTTAVVLSGASFAALRRYQVPPGSLKLGWGLADLGDLDSDGVHDYSIAGDKGDSFGFVALFSGAAGYLIVEMDGSQPGDLFGMNVAGAGDVNGDGTPDILVKRNHADMFYPGYVNCFSGKDGSLIKTLSGNQIGFSMGRVGDLDGDGCDEVILGKPYFTSPHGGLGGPGSAIVYSFKKDATLYMHTQGDNGDWLGYQVGGLGDVNGDGLPDYFFSSPSGNQDLGKVWVHSGADGSLLFSISGQEDQLHMGIRAAAAGDVNGDGRCDLLVGSTADLYPPAYDGHLALHVLSPPFTWEALGLGGTLPAPILYGLGSLQPAAATEVGLNGALPGSLGVLVAGLGALNAPFKGGTMVPEPDVIVPLPPVGADGHAALVFHWPALPASTTLYVQAWHADAGGPAGFAASNALAAVTP